MKSSCFTVSHILDAVDESSHADEKHSATNAKDLRCVSPRRANSDNVKVDIVLQEAELWRKFHSLVNEMIVTKNGRRMFPVIKVAVSGLDPHSMYSFLLDFVAVGETRWKYVNGDWTPGGKAESSTSSCVYVHPDSPNFGAHWMRQPISFSKIKLTNKQNTSGQIVLNSLHKYEPRLVILRIGSSNERKTVTTHSFPETQFVAVTAYQNEEITSLKIKFNPFAKAYWYAKERQEHKDTTEQLPEAQSSCSSYGWLCSSGLYPTHPSHHHRLRTTTCDRFALRNHRANPYSTTFMKRPSSGSAQPLYENQSSSLGILSRTSRLGDPHNTLWVPSTTSTSLAWTASNSPYNSISDSSRYLHNDFGKFSSAPFACNGHLSTLASGGFAPWS